jgi:hypothetical protein
MNQSAKSICLVVPKRCIHNGEVYDIVLVKDVSNQSGTYLGSLGNMAKNDFPILSNNTQGSKASYTKDEKSIDH